MQTFDEFLESKGYRVVEDHSTTASRPYTLYHGNIKYASFTAQMHELKKLHDEWRNVKKEGTGITLPHEEDY